MKIVTIVGARPQFVKAAAVSRVLRSVAGVREVLVHTGQHYDANMSDVFFDEMDIPRPDHHLGVGSGSHGAQTGRMLEAIETVLQAERPDWALVYGDTNSTLAGALAAAKLHIDVAHVEAGLRSFNRRMPEELNRIVTDHLSTRLFAPTSLAMANLAREGFDDSRARLTGDVMYDAVLFYRDRAARTSRVLESLGVRSGEFALVTIHRAENTDDPARMHVLVSALRRLSGELTLVWPVHPRTRGTLAGLGLTEGNNAGLRLVDPVGYFDMLMLEQHARVVLTDSGGVQKEAFFARVPCVTLRDETEWMELVEAGWNRLAPPGTEEQIVSGVRAAIASPPASQPPALFGEGHAADAITRLLTEK